jgi:hypothetical protein
LNGVLQYQFWNDLNANNVLSVADGDTLLRDWADSSTFVDAPQGTTTYGVQVRCSSDTACDQSGLDATSRTIAQVSVPCPSTGTAKAKFGQSIAVNKGGIGGAEPDLTSTVSWGVPGLVDGIRGNLSALKAASGNYTGTVLACIGENVNVNALASDNLNPGAGQAFYYLVRPAVLTLCNETGFSYSTGHPKEAAGRDAEIDAQVGNRCTPP